MSPKEDGSFCLIPGHRIRASLAKTKGSSSEEDRLAHLDGLRAVALIGVFLFHFRVPFFRGGYLGVDVFFVLSGFLMTRALLLKVDAEKFSFRQFLSLRALRIYPAHVTTVLATLLCGLHMFPVSMIPRLSDSSNAASLFISNMKFLAENGYHDTASSLKPLLHSWSLCVEVQFYLLWSCVALIGSVEHVVAAMLFLSSASVGIHVFAAHDTAALFFCPWSRLYEFGAGALALLCYDALSPIASNILGLGGVVAVVGTMTLAKPHHQPIFLVSLPIVVGTTALIASPRGIVSRALGRSKILAYIGKISYSAYLVHWPAIVFWTFAVKDERLALSCAFASTIILSFFLFHVVEDFFRGKRENRFSHKGLWFSILVIFGILYISILSKSEATTRLKQLEVAAAKSGGFTLKTREGYVKEQLGTRGALLRNGSFIWYSKKVSKPFALVVGDSFAAHLFPLMASSGTNKTKTKISGTYYMCANGCPPIIIPKDAVSESRQQTAACKKSAENVSQVLRQRAGTIFFINRWQDHMFLKSKFESPRVYRPFLPPKDIIKRVSRSLRAAVKVADRVKVIGFTPHPKLTTVECLWKHMEGQQLSPTANVSCPYHFEVPEAEMTWNDEFREFIKREHPGVEYVDVIRNSKLCKDRKCIAWDKRRGPMHFDEAGHLTHEGALLAMSSVSME